MCGTDKLRAKQIIVEIIQQAGGEFTRKTNLFKAFYLAHLIYAERAPGYLSDWPIVRLPNGPGIEAAGTLLDELVADGIVASERVPIGPYVAMKYVLIGKPLAGEPLPPLAIVAIKEAVDWVQSKGAVEISELTHEFSRAWNAGRNGEELNIYIDGIAEDEYDNRERDLDELGRAMMQAWDAGRG